MINIISFSDETFEKDWVPLLERAFSDAKKLLTRLPASFNIAFAAEGAEDITGVGGFSVSPTRINIALTKDFHDRELQERNLRGVLFHELLHVNQGFTFEQSPFTALDAAIYEGCAVIFEQKYGDGVAIYADYHSHSDVELSGWLEQLREVGTKYFEDYDTWQRWAFYHPELDQKWIIYKVGAWIIEDILARNALTVLDLANKTSAEIMHLAAPAFQLPATQ